VASLLFGLATPVGLAAAGLAALVLGWHGLRAVNQSDGRLRGRRLAVAGMVLGGLGVAATALGLAILFLVDWHVRAQRAECLNNLRQIGAAAQAYRDKDEHEAFPPGTLPNADLPPEQRLSWLVALPPYLQESTPGVKKLQALDGQIDLSRAWDDPANAAAATTDVYLFRCPAHPHDDPGATPGHTHYVGIAGVGPDAARLPASDPRAGVFGYDRALRQTDLTAGAAPTLFAVETTSHNGQWTAGGLPTVRGIDPDDAPPLGPGCPFGGLHSGGANVLWADGSAKFMANSVSPAFFAWSSRVHRDDEAPAP
jgi:prepilin-type processing-associated H-X9-DG protein